MPKKYKVTAPCVVHIPVSTSDGPMLATFYKDALLPEGVPADKLKHLLGSNLIAEIAEVDESPAEPKLNARTSKGDLVAHAVAQGDMTQEEAEALSLKDLQARYVNKPDSKPAE